MLGYVRTERQELRVREDAFYRALYCGLCHRMGKCTGQCSRMTLNYDFVFLAVVRLVLTGEKPTVKKQRCMVHPFRARPTVQACGALDFCADASALLVYHKLKDDLKDEKGLKKLRAILSKPLMALAYRRAKKRHPDLDREIALHLERLSDYEKKERAFGSADELAAQFGKLMEAVFCEGLPEREARIAAVLGRAVGHWIYLVDAADDFDEDRKRGRFNPYLQLFGENPTEADWENLRLALTALLCDAERGFLLMEDHSISELREILANILYLGMPATAKKMTEKLGNARDDRFLER